MAVEEVDLGGGGEVALARFTSFSGEPSVLSFRALAAALAENLSREHERQVRLLEERMRQELRADMARPPSGETRDCAFKEVISSEIAEPVASLVASSIDFAVEEHFLKQRSRAQRILVDQGRFGAPSPIEAIEEEQDGADENAANEEMNKASMPQWHHGAAPVQVLSPTFTEATPTPDAGDMRKEISTLRTASTNSVGRILFQYFGDHHDADSDGGRPHVTHPIFAPVGRVLEGIQFEMCIGVLIVVNTFIMALEIQYQGTLVAYTIGLPGIGNPSKNWPSADLLFPLFEKIFTVIFTVELLLRVIVFGTEYFKRALNWLDVIVVVVGILSWFYFDDDEEDDTVVNPMMARLLRLIKLGRGLKLIKMSSILDNLHLILKSIALSVTTLFWSLTLLFTIQCIFAMMINQLVRSYILEAIDVEEQEEYDKRAYVYSYYGTFTRSLLTMFEVTFANWAPAARALVHNIGEEYSLFFIAYRCCIGFAVLNVIQAVFIQQTLKVAHQDEEVMIKAKQKQQMDSAHKVQRLFAQLDSSGDGNISFEEFAEALGNPKIRAFISALEVDASDLEVLFDLLDDGDGMISILEFTSGMRRIKGPAQGQDVAKLMKHVIHTEHTLENLCSSMSVLTGCDVLSRNLRSTHGGPKFHGSKSGVREGVASSAGIESSESPVKTDSQSGVPSALHPANGESGLSPKLGLQPRSPGRSGGEPEPTTSV